MNIKFTNQPRIEDMVRAATGQYDHFDHENNCGVVEVPPLEEVDLDDRLLEENQSEWIETSGDLRSHRINRILAILRM
jgi:hypothetical protein